MSIIDKVAPRPWTTHDGEIYDANGERLFFVDDGGAFTTRQIAEFICERVNEQSTEWK